MVDNGYYKHVRHDVLAHVPKGTSHVLSIGCGEGWTERQLIEQGIAVTGVELNADAAKVASLAGLNIICGDARQAEMTGDSTRFDCLLYADVLEHMTDPESVMRRHVELLTPSAVTIVSVPNFRHYSVFRQLFLAGHIRYCDQGIFDRTHLRLTTRRMIEEWFASVGLTVTRIDYRINRKRDRLISMLTFGLLREFLASQVIVVGRLNGTRLGSTT